MASNQMCRVELHRKSTLNSNQAQRTRIEYVQASTEQEAKERACQFQRNQAFVAMSARRA